MIKNRIKEYRARYDMKQEDLSMMFTIGNLKLVIRYHSVFKIIMVKQLQKN